MSEKTVALITMVLVCFFCACHSKPGKQADINSKKNELSAEEATELKNDCLTCDSIFKAFPKDEHAFERVYYGIETLSRSIRYGKSRSFCKIAAKITHS